MSVWNCRTMCKKYEHCTNFDECIVPSVRREVERAENPRRKKRIEIVYEHELEGTGHEKYEECVYGRKKGE